MTPSAANQCALCEREAVEYEINVALCEKHLARLETTNAQPESDRPTKSTNSGTGNTNRDHCTVQTDHTVDSWHELTFSATQEDTYPPTLLEREQWMGQRKDEKLPFAPWGDKDHPDADADEDARYKWGLAANYLDGDDISMAEVDPRLSGRTFIQQADDPFAFVDGDNVRCPETGKVHPAFLDILDQLGMTYADISTSGRGIHAQYIGDLPEDQGQAVFTIDTEPWGENDTAPTVEIYSNKHVCVASGEKISGTADDVNKWDTEAIEAILDKYDARKHTESVSHDTNQSHVDLSNYQPSTTDPTETVDDIRAIFAAIARLDPQGIPLQSQQTGVDATGWETYNPAYRPSESGESLHYNGKGVFYDHKHDEEFGLLALFAAEQGIISNPWDRLVGADWWETVETAREAGVAIPEYSGGDQNKPQHTAVLPPAVRDLSRATTGWDWTHTSNRGSLTIDEARERTVEAIVEAYESGEQVLIEALMSMGKSYGAILAAKRTGQPITFLTRRGHKEQYDQIKDWCQEHGLEYYQLPSFKHDCDTANGEHGEAWAERVRDLYRRGVTPKEIHAKAEHHLGEPLPCQRHDGCNCAYTSKWKFDPDEYDVLIGHYSHAYQQTVTAGRTVVIDEFPSAYESELPQVQGPVSHWLDITDGVPFDSWTDLIANRDDEQRRSDAILWFEEHGVTPDESHVFESPQAHADAPLVVFSLLAGNDLGNGLEVADIPDIGRSVYSQATEQIHTLRPPSMDYANGIVCLDGTPTKEMWTAAVGTRLDHRSVLTSDERIEYVQNTLNLNVVRASEHVKSYNSREYVHTANDGALLEEIAEEYGKKPGVVTTKTALREYVDRGILSADLETGVVTDGPADRVQWYGDVLGSNAFKEKRLGVVIGSNHYGDQYIKRWGAYLGEAVTRKSWADVAAAEDTDISHADINPDNRDAPAKGSHLAYTGVGNDILTHMREHETLQAAMRFGRDGNGAVVYILTDTLPDWVPVAGEARVIQTWSDGMQQVIEVAGRAETFRTAEIADHPAVDVGNRQVLNILQKLKSTGYLTVEVVGRGYTWQDDGLHRINEHGDVELEPINVASLTSEEVDEIFRNSIHTWNFVSAEIKSKRQYSSTEDTAQSRTIRGVVGGDPPPDG